MNHQGRSAHGALGEGATRRSFNCAVESKPAMLSLRIAKLECQVACSTRCRQQQMAGHKVLSSSSSCPLDGWIRIRGRWWGEFTNPKKDGTGFSPLQARQGVHEPQYIAASAMAGNHIKTGRNEFMHCVSAQCWTANPSCERGHPDGGKGGISVEHFAYTRSPFPIYHE